MESERAKKKSYLTLDIAIDPDAGDAVLSFVTSTHSDVLFTGLELPRIVIALEYNGNVSWIARMLQSCQLYKLFLESEDDLWSSLMSIRLGLVLFFILHYEVRCMFW